MNYSWVFYNEINYLSLRNMSSTDDSKKQEYGSE